MVKRAKPGPKSDAETIAAAEAASKTRGAVQASLVNLLAKSDAKVDDGQDIPFSWIGYLGKLLASERSASIWDNADGGEDEEAPR